MIDIFGRGITYLRVSVTEEPAWKWRRFPLSAPPLCSVRYVQSGVKGYDDHGHPPAFQNRRNSRQLQTGGRIMAYTAAVITISDKGYRASGRTPAASAENILAVIDPVAHGLDMLYSEGSADCAK